MPAAGGAVPGLHLALPRAASTSRSTSRPGSDLSWLHIVPNITAKADSHWSGFLLLAVYAVSQVLSTYFMSATMEKSQRTMMMIVPLVFITFIAHFPTGLVLYWVTTNLWTVGQGVVTRRLVPKTPPPAQPAPKRSSRTPPEVGAAGNGATQAAAAPQPKPQPPAAERSRGASSARRAAPRR